MSSTFVLCQSTRPRIVQQCSRDRTRWTPTRRELLFTLSLSQFLSPLKSCAVQGSTAGRLPGVSENVDSEGFYLYKRPAGKSGGHGVGWSEIVPYSFRVPPGWEEVPVSIADLGGTEIDLRFANESEGNLEVVVAPVLRFLDVGFNANIRIDEIGSPQKLIEGFAPELFGVPLEDDDVLSANVIERNGLTYYTWEIKPRRLVTATASGNRVYLISVTANSRQWRNASTKLKTIAESFSL